MLFVFCFFPLRKTNLDFCSLKISRLCCRWTGKSDVPHLCLAAYIELQLKFPMTLFLANHSTMALLHIRNFLNKPPSSKSLPRPSQTALKRHYATILSRFCLPSLSPYVSPSTKQSKRDLKMPSVTKQSKSDTIERERFVPRTGLQEATLLLKLQVVYMFFYHHWLYFVVFFWFLLFIFIFYFIFYFLFSPFSIIWLNIFWPYIYLIIPHILYLTLPFPSSSNPLCS